jgi:hypothetical protein
VTSPRRTRRVTPRVDAQRPSHTPRFASSSCLVSIASVFPAPFLTDRRPSSNRNLGLPSSHQQTRKYTSPRADQALRLIASPTTARRLGSVRDSIAGLEMTTLYIGRFVRSISPFTLDVCSPFYAFTFTLDVAFEYCGYCRTLLRLRTRRCPPGDHSNIFFFFFAFGLISLLFDYDAVRPVASRTIFVCFPSPDHLTTIQVCSTVTHHLARAFLCFRFLLSV